MNIRKSVFETNSSSSHSIVTSDGIDFEVVNIEGDEVKIEPGEFGWGYDVLKTWHGRASYAYTYAKNYGKEKDIETLKKVIKDYTKKEVVFMSMSGEAKFQRTVDVLTSLSSQGLDIPFDKGIKAAEEAKMDDEEDFGYIDHQSIEDAEQIFSSYDNVKKVVFGKGSIITIDNDNH